MEPTAGQGELFRELPVDDDGKVFINDRCRLQTEDGYRVVSVCGVVLAHFRVDDPMSEALAMVSLVDQGWATQGEVARAFGYSERTVRRDQRRFEVGGLAALGRPSGYPKGRARLPTTRVEKVNLWKEQGESQREIARRLGVTEKAVRKLLLRLGWKEEVPEQLSLVGLDAAPVSSRLPARAQGVAVTGAVLGTGSGEPGFSTADPNLSGLAPQGRANPSVQAATTVVEGGGQPPVAVPSTADPNLSGLASQDPPVDAAQAATAAVESGERAAEAFPSGADPNLSGSDFSGDPWLPRSCDVDPGDRSADRLLACLGLLDDAPPLFGPGRGVAGVGVLLALPALLESGVIPIAREVYGSLGPAFYGLRTTLVTFLLMALLRIRRPEGLKERSPQELGRILGLDRAPEVKTLRQKLAQLASYGRAADFGHALAAHRVARRGYAMGFLYIDGHVRAYHGDRKIPKTHVARLRTSMPATTDYWVQDAKGEPLFVVTSEANKGLVRMLPDVLDEVRTLVGDRRLTVVFDRGGWSPKLFKKLIAQGFDLLTYRKGRSRRVAKSRFSLHEATIDGQKVRYLLADQNILLLKRKLRLRQVTRLSPNGHQTPILTSRQDLPAIEVAFRMFERWRQENFFKYLREEYALDALVDYGVEPAEPTRSVPNPQRKQIDAEIHRARAHLAQLETEYGLEALENPEARRRTMRGFKIANSKLAQRIRDAMERVATLEKKRARIPARVPVQEVVQGEVIQLATERKHLTDLLKMVAYQAEGELLQIVEAHYRRSEDEGRTFIQSALASSGDIAVTETELHIALQPLSSPHRTHILAALCEHLNATRACYPGTALHLRFSVQKEPQASMAFPGAKPPKTRSKTGQPDSLEAG